MTMGVLNKLLILFFILSFALPGVAQEKPKKRFEIVRRAKTQPGAFCPNIQFVVDTSSTIHTNDDLMQEFAIAWSWITSRVASDEVYFSVCIFHDDKEFVISKWINAGGPNGYKEFNKAWKWIKANTGTYSYGLEAVKRSIKRLNPLIRNRVTRRRLTVVIITDGGFTEAADYEPKGEGKNKESHFKPLDDAIVEAQAWRKARGLFPAAICTIGLQNSEWWSLSVKRRDDECQSWLEKIGRKYSGGYLLIREKK